MDKKLFAFAAAVVCVAAATYWVRDSDPASGRAQASESAVVAGEDTSAGQRASRPVVVDDARSARLGAALQAAQDAPPPFVEAPAEPRLDEDFEPPLEGAELEKERTRVLFDERVTPRLKECLAGAQPSGRVKLSFLFVKDEEGDWRLASSAEELAAVGVQDAEAISLLDSTLPAELDAELVRCMHQATEGMALEPVERHRDARYYRVYWRWTFGS